MVDTDGKLGFWWLDALVKQYKWRLVIRPICNTILYHNLLLFIDIFHIMDMILMLFPLFCMYDDYEGNNCRSQILMEKSNIKTPYLRRSEASGKAILRSFATEDGGSQKEEVWCAIGGPHLPQARGTSWSAPGQGVAPLAPLWPSHFAYFIPSTGKP